MATSIRIVDEWRRPLERTYRSDAYYYGFDLTGCDPVDRILSSVAIAGECFHNTSEWTDSGTFKTGQSCIELIQQEAGDAANAFTTLLYSAFCNQWIVVAWCMLIGTDAPSEMGGGE